MNEPLEIRIGPQRFRIRGEYVFHVSAATGAEYATDGLLTGAVREVARLAEENASLHDLVADLEFEIRRLRDNELAEHLR